MMSFGAVRPANGGAIDPVQKALFGDAGRRCTSPTTGGPSTRTATPTARPASAATPSEGIYTNRRTPGNQGPTYKGRARVPEGQSYSAEPTGIAPSVLP